MKKTLIAATILGTCSIANAYSSDCSYSTDYNIDINEKRVLFSKEKGDSFEFKGDQLIINGNTVHLTKEQQKTSRGLQAGARAMVPKIAEIAAEGAELGIKATTLVLTSLFDDDPEMRQELLAPIEEISEKVKQNINKTQLNTEALEKSFDAVFDDKFEKVIETAVAKYSSKIVSNVLGSLFSGDKEEIEDLEFRMDNLEQDIEQYVEANATELENKADALCQDLKALDLLDNQLEQVDGYPKDGLFHSDNDGGFNFSGISLDLY